MFACLHAIPPDRHLLTPHSPRIWLLYDTRWHQSGRTPNLRSPLVRAPGVAKVLAYDCHQNISQFRRVTSNAVLTSMPTTHARSLPQSFRFGPAVAKLLTDFIRRHKHLRTFHVQGNPAKSTQVSYVRNCDEAYREAFAQSDVQPLAAAA